MAAAGIGHNSNLTPAEKRALYFHHFTKISGQRAVVEQAQAVEKTFRKQAKADGLVLADIDFGLRVNKLEDDSIIVEEALRRHQIMQWMGVPIGTQGAFNFKRDVAATREGTAAGLAAKERKSPYEPGSFEDQDWLTAYDGAQAEMREAFATAMEKKLAERQAAARKNGADDAEDESEDEKQTEAA